MTQTVTQNLDYLAARAHARRSRLVDAPRLDALCRLRSVPELAAMLHPEFKTETAATWQHQLTQELIRELIDWQNNLEGPAARLLNWLLVRFQLENLKILLRAWLARVPAATVRPQLVPLPPELMLDAAIPAGATLLSHFARQLPEGVFRECLEQTPARAPATAQLFLTEAALDHAYFQELLHRTTQLAGEDRDCLRALAQQEADTFHLMLVARGKFVHGLPAEHLNRWHVAGTRISRIRFNAMLADADLRTALRRAVGLALDAMPTTSEGEPATVSLAVALEAAATQRLMRLANRACRGGFTGLGVIVGHAVLRRLEAANLTTLSEGIRLAMPGEAIRARLTSGQKGEAMHV
jgi:vacuolar-type H+-ATPase subunit C/Vma6